MITVISKSDYSDLTSIMRESYHLQLLLVERIDSSLTNSRHRTIARDEITQLSVGVVWLDRIDSCKFARCNPPVSDGETCGTNAPWGVFCATAICRR